MKKTITINNTQNKISHTTIEIEQWSPKMRLLSSAKLLGILWAIALASVFLPLAHFLLVPTFLIAGPIAAWKKYQQHSHILPVEFTCPICNHGLALKHRAAKWPIEITCPKCLNNLNLNPS